MLKKPLCVARTFLRDGRIVFGLPGEEHSLKPEISTEVWRILELCDGLNTIDTIIDRLEDVNGEFITALLEP